MNKKVIFTVILVAAVGIGFSVWKYMGTSKVELAQPSDKPIATADITISNFSFLPSSFTVKAGQKVNVLNSDSVEHSLVSDNGLFDTGLISNGQVGSFTAPTAQGTYTYHCSIHKTMTGTLIVQ